MKRLRIAGASLPYRFDDKFHGITPLYEASKDVDVDVIAVPGLGGHTIGSWKSPSGNDVWLRDYLPDDVPNIRVLLYGYDTSLLRNKSKDSIEDLGRRFLELIQAFRTDNASRRPVIFIGHSLGGLLIKEALLQRDRTLAKTGPQKYMVTEKSATNIGLTATADEYNISLNTDHSGLVKYKSKSQDEYIIVKEKLKKFVAQAKRDVGKRVIEEDLTPEQERLWSSLNQPPYTSFRHSSKIAKREEGTLEWLVQETSAGGNHDSSSEHELPRLRKEDFTSWRDSDKSEVLLITAPPGRGKSVLSNFVLGYLERKKSQTPSLSTKIIYYFCNIKNDEASRNANSILRALIVQLWEGFNDMREFIRDQLFQQAENSFLWLEVVIRRIIAIDMPTERKIKTIIRKSPQDLDKLYQEIIQCLIQEDEDKDKARLLACVIYARRPLTLRALQDAVAINPMERYTKYEQCKQDKSSLTPNEFYQIFGTLLDVAEDKVYCIHQSVKDYFQRYNPLKHFTDLDPRLVLAHASMAYISLEDFEHPWQNREMLWHNFPFFEYAANYWYSHIETAADVRCYLAFQDFLKEMVPPVVCKAQVWMSEHRYSRFYSHPSRVSEVAICFDIGWLTELLLNREPCGIADDFEKDCLSLAAKQKGVVLEVLLKHERNIKFAITDDIVRDIARTHHCTTMTLLLDRRGADVQITEGVVQAAAGNDGSGKEIITLLLDRRGADIQIIEKVVQAAAGNNWRGKESGEEIITLLLDRRGADVQITEKVVQAAARNYKSGKEVITLLLNRRGADVQITEKVVQAAARNSRSGKEIITLLLDRRGADVQITEGVVKRIAEYFDQEVITLLLDRRGADVQITERVVKQIVKRFDQEVITFLLDRRGADVQITEKVVQAAARNYESGGEIITLLLDRRGADVQITEKVVQAAIGNKWSGKEVITLLLDRRGADVQITEGVVKRIAECFDQEVITLLLDRRGADVQITEELVEAAAENSISGKEIITLLLDRRGADVQITEKVVQAAAGNNSSGKEIITLLLDRRGADIQITEKVVQAAAGNN
ncbi:MAG: hypothetical protein LQ342_008341 [Letrouitia transgressa]|nr:MAG: hypothetical protein LQ342_008341 [Letrouitia transgressa]